MHSKTFILCCLILYSTAIWGQKDKALKLLVHQADSMCQLAQHQNAVVLLEKATAQAEKQADWEMYSHIQNSLAEALLQLGKFDKAFQTAQKNIEHIKKQGHNEVLKADALLTIGLIHLNKGDGDAALKTCEQALAIYETKLGGKHEKTADCLSRIAVVYWDLDNDKQALDHHLRALAIRKSIFGENALPVAASYNDIGLVYAANEPEKALPYYEKAQKVYEEVYGLTHPKVANACLNIAYVERSRKKYDVAMEKAVVALAIWRKVYESTHPNEAVVLSFIGQLYADQEKWGMALSQQQQALTIYKKFFGEKHPKTANAYQLIGVAYLQQEEHKKALEYLQKALVSNIPSYDNTDIRDNPDGKSYYNPTLLINTLLFKAEAMEGYHYGKSLRFRDLKVAYETLLLCDGLIEQQRQVKESKQDKLALGKIASELYERAIRLCLAMAEVTPNSRLYREQAFGFSERGKASVLLGAISDTKAKEFANIPDKLLERELALKVEITVLEQKLTELSNPEEEVVFRQELHRLQNNYQSFVDSLEQSFPAYYNLKYNVATVNVRTLQAFLKTGEALISYYIAPKFERLYVFRFTKDDFEVQDVPLSADLNKLVLGFQNGIKYQVRGAWASVGYDLYEQLFPKWKGKGIERLVIVPDGVLGTVPFEALVMEEIGEDMSSSDIPFLIQSYAISYAYSATIFTQTFKEAPSITSPKALLCAPVLFASRSEDRSQRYLDDLPGTQEEIRQIALTLQSKGLSTDVLTKQAANESVMKSDALSQYQVLHFATHGIVDQEHPERSQIYLYPDAGKEDGHLFASEIYNISTKADLVVFSACQTGLGKISVGEGIIGLSRALLYAGARNIVVSLWSVSDASTSELMQSFYQQLEAGKPTGYQSPLRKAKLQMIQGGQFAEPYFWAPFILLGR